MAQDSAASSDSISQPGLTTTPALGKHDLAVIVNELAQVASKWVLVGTCLGVDQSEIEEIEKLKLSPKEALLKVISKWLDTSHDRSLTWKDITESLRQPVLKEERVAEQIERNIYYQLRSRSFSSPPQLGDYFSSKIYSRCESTPATVTQTLIQTDNLSQSTISNSILAGPIPPLQSSVSAQVDITHTPSSTPSTKSAQTQTTTADPSSSVSSTVHGQTPSLIEANNRLSECPAVDKFVQSCLDSLPKVHSESIPCHSSSESTPSCSSSSSSSVLSAQSIQLECKVFNGANGRQIQCTKVSRKELREVYRDIKLKVKKFDTVPPCTPIFFRVLANKPCYIYIINQGSSGNLTTLIPNECDKNNRLLRPDHFIQFPSPNADYEFELDQNCGTETIIVLAYSDALGDPKQAEKDCEDILKSGEEKDVLRDVKVHKKTSQQFLCRGCIEIQFTVK